MAGSIPLRQVEGFCLPRPATFHMGYKLNSLKGGYIGDYVGD